MSHTNSGCSAHPEAASILGRIRPSWVTTGGCPRAGRYGGRLRAGVDLVCLMDTADINLARHREESEMAREFQLSTPTDDVTAVEPPVSSPDAEEGRPS